MIMPVTCLTWKTFLRLWHLITLSKVNGVQINLWENTIVAPQVISFYGPEIEDQGANCFCPVCHSVILSETLTLLITFEQRVLELRYFTCIFPVIRPFRGYHYFFTVTLTLGFDPFFENFNLANNF